MPNASARGDDDRRFVDESYFRFCLQQIRSFTWRRELNGSRRRERVTSCGVRHVRGWKS